MARSFKRIAVYCGASSNVDPKWLALAFDVGAALATRGLGVVYGGGRVGLMGAVADGALSKNGEVIGVIPKKLLDHELGHTGCTRLEVVETMHERKARMAELADGFIALPGGFGTLEETFEVVTWSQLDYHRKPVGLLDADGFYQGLVRFVDHAMEAGFIRPFHRTILSDAPDLDALLARMAEAELVGTEGWLRTP